MNGLTDYKSNVNNRSESLNQPYIDAYIDNKKNSFKYSPSYTEVTINSSNTIYDTWIIKGDIEDKDVGYKKLISYPYDTIQFSRGDYINFKYGDEDTVWLLETLDKQHSYDITGRIFQCLQNLKWKDSTGTLFSYPCVIQDNLKRSIFDFNKNIIIPQGTIFLDVQQNEDTMKIKVNQRFMFDGQVFKTNFVESFIGGNYMTLTLEKDELGINDDIVNNIANNVIDTTPIIVSTEIRITPNNGVNKILQGNTVNFSVLQFISGTQNTNTFTFTPSNASLNNYVFTVVDGNNFSVKSLGNDINNLVVTCKNNVSLVEKTVSIKLAGLY